MKAKNVLFPGRENYEGPTKGWFGLLHHSDLFEYSYNVFERVEYVKSNKPGDEIEVRLYNMIYLDIPEYDKARVWEEYDKARAEYDKAWTEYDKAREEYDKAWTEYDKAREEYVKARVWEESKARVEYDKARAEYDKARVKARAWEEYDKARAEYDKARVELRPVVLAYIRHHIPNTAWNEKRKTLDFTR